MYFNIFGYKLSRRRWKEALSAQKNRQELITAGLGRRELFKLGLLTSGAAAVGPERTQCLGRRLRPRCMSVGLQPADHAFHRSPHDCPDTAGATAHRSRIRNAAQRL